MDPDHWFDHYEAKGWKIGKSPMRDWRAAVRTWEKNEFGAGGQKRVVGEAAPVAGKYGPGETIDTGS